MDTVRSSWPLLVFTTIAPLAAGAWALVAALALFDVFPGAAALTVGGFGLLLCLLFAASLACSVLHLGRPTKAFRALRRLGNSSVSNEVFVGGLFAMLALIYVVVAEGLMAAGDVWKMLLGLIAGCAVVFVLFQCLAYRMRTVPTWNSPAFALEFAAIALLGGVCLVGAFVPFGPAVPDGVRWVLLGLEAVCCGVMLLVATAQDATVAALPLDRDARAWRGRWGVARVLALVAGSGLWIAGMAAPAPIPELLVLGTVVVVVGIAVGRALFYGSYINVGLPQA